MSASERDKAFEETYVDFKHAEEDISLFVNTTISESRTSNLSSETNKQPIFEEDNSFVETYVGSSDKLPPDKVHSLNYKLRNADTCEESKFFVDASVNSMTETPVSSLQSTDTESRNVVDHEHIDDKLKSLPSFKHNDDNKSLKPAREHLTEHLIANPIHEKTNNKEETKPNLQTKPEINKGKETDTILEDNDKLHEVKIEDTSLTIEPKQMDTALTDSSKQQTKTRNVEGEEINAAHETFDVENTIKSASNDNTVNTKQTKKYQGLTLTKIDKLWCLCFKEIVTILPKLLNSDEGIALEVLEESAFLVTSGGSLFEVKLENDSIQVVALDQATILHQDEAKENDENVSMSDTAIANNVKLQPSDVPDMPIDKDMDSETRPNASETTIPVTACQFKRYEGLTLEKNNSQYSLSYKKINKKLSAPFIGDEGLALEVLEDSAFLVTSDGCLFEVKVDNTTIKVESLDQAVVLPQDDTNDKEEQPPRQESTDDKAVKSHPHIVSIRTSDENTALQESEKDRPDSQNDGGSYTPRQVPHVEVIHNFTNEIYEKDVKTNEKSEIEGKLKVVIDDECAEDELNMHLRSKLTKEDNVEVNISLDNAQSKIQEHNVDGSIASNEHVPRSLVHDNIPHNIDEHQLANSNNKKEMKKSNQESQQRPVIVDEAFPDMTRHIAENSSTGKQRDDKIQLKTVIPINLGQPCDTENKDCDVFGKCTGRSNPNQNKGQVQNDFQTNSTDLNKRVLKHQSDIGSNLNGIDVNKNMNVKPIPTVTSSPETRKVRSNSKSNQTHGEDAKIQTTTESANIDVSGAKLEQSDQDQTSSHFVAFIVTYPESKANSYVTQRITRECTFEEYMKWKYGMHSSHVQQDLGRCLSAACSKDIMVEQDQICFKEVVTVEIISRAIDILMGKLEISDIQVNVIIVENEPEICQQKITRSGFATSNHLYAEILDGKVYVVYETENKPAIEDFLRKEIFQGNSQNFDYALKRCMAVKPKVGKATISLQQFWAPLSCKTGLVKCLEEEFPVMNIFTKESATSFDITFIGTERQIESAQVYFNSEFCKKLKTKSVSTRIEQTDVYLKTSLVQMAQKHIEDCRCIVVLQISPKEKLTVYGFGQNEVENAVFKLSMFVTEQRDIVTGHFRNKEVISPILKAIQQRYEGVLLTIDKAVAAVYVTGYKDNVIKALNDLKIKMDEKKATDASTFEKQIVIRQRDAYSVLVNDTIFQARMKERYNVQMSTLKRQNELGFVLTGEPFQVLKCEEELQKYVNRIVTETVQLTDEHELKLKKRKQALNTADLECKAKTVNEPGPFPKIEIDKTQENRKTWLFPGGQKIVLYRKAVSDSEADVVVSRIDVSQEPGIKMAHTDQLGVFYDVHIPFFKNGRSDEEFAAMKVFRKILETAEKDKETSVAFPLEAVKSWHMSSQTKCLVKCIGHFFLKQASSLKPRFALLCTDDAELYNLYFDWCKSTIQELETERSDESVGNIQQPVQINVVIGSLNTIEADVIVNTTAVSLDLKAGAVSAAILKSAGQGLQNECRNKYPKGIKNGEVAVTEGYNLKCKHVFHGSIPLYNKNDTASSMQNLRHFVNNCLSEANELKMTSIAFPAIGAGNLSYPVTIVAEEMFNEVLRFQQQSKFSISLKEVKFVIFPADTNAVQEFQKREKKWYQPETNANSRTDVMSMKLRTNDSRENAEVEKTPTQETQSIPKNTTHDRVWITQTKHDLGGYVKGDTVEAPNISNAPTVPPRSYADAAARPKTTPAVTTQPSSIGQTEVFVCYTTKNVAIRVYKKDIFHLNVDCIVNPANEHLQHKTGLSQCIATRAGRDLIRESDAYKNQYNTIRVGNAVATTAGKLHYKCVVHAVGPIWPSHSSHSSNVENFRRDLQNTIFQCLVAAEERKMTSIAFPSVSAAKERPVPRPPEHNTKTKTGIDGVSKTICAAAYADGIIAYDISTGFGNKELKEIHFVDRDISMVDIIKHTMKVMIKDRKPCPYSFQAPISTIPTTLEDNNRFVKDSVAGQKNTVTNKPTQQHDNKFPSYHEQGGKLVCKFSNNHTILIYSGDIFAIHGVKAIACGEDATGDAQGYVANKLKHLGKYSYEQVKKSAFTSSKPIKVGDVIISGGGQNKFEWILHAIVPLRQQFSSESEWEKPYGKMFDTIFGKATQTRLTSVVLSLLGTGRGSSDVRRCAEIFLDSYTVACNRYTGKQLTVHMVNNETPKTDCLTKLFKEHIDRAKAYKVPDTATTHDFRVSINYTDSGAGRNVSYTPTPKWDNSHQGHDKSSKQSATASNYTPPVTRSSSQTEKCLICLSGIKKPKTLICKHSFCTDCIDQQFKIKKVCPTCGQICGILIGDQPHGDMAITKTSDQLSGFRQCTLSLTYTFKDGKQQRNHPNPGTRYSGMKRIAYLPDTDEGRELCAMLSVAFTRKLVFTIGRSNTTGGDGVITWNDIHHKTSLRHNATYGFPDRGFFDRVRGELKSKGVTEADVDKVFLGKLKGLYIGSTIKV